jgi:cardiolipin synthase A/B
MTHPVERATRLSTITRTEAQRAIDRAAAARPIPGNRVALLQDGPEAYAAMLALIAGARRFIHFENYIFRADPTGWRFAEALAERARAGIAVRVLYDWLGCIGTRRKYWRFLRGAGCEVRCFNPPRLFRPFRLLARDHRKLVVTDCGHAVMGGLCIGDEWAGDPAKGIPPWRDTAVLIEGPASQALDTAFQRVWALTGPPLPDDESAGDVAAVGEASVRVVVGVPGRERAYRVLEYLAAGCRRRLWIVDAYLVPPPRLFEVLALAEKDGVDIRLLLPGSSDVPLVRNLTRIGYRDMLRAGLRIFEWEGVMMHAKTMVADGRWARVGTSNINASSLIGNYELDVVIEDPVLARTMEQQFRRDIAASVEVVRRPRRAPAALSRVMPSRLARRGRQDRAVPPRGRRELRARAVVAARRLASGAFRSLFGPISLVLVVVGLLSVGLPTIMGYVFGGVSLWFALAAGLQAWRRRSPGE